MARAIWSGAISFGLVSLPVKAFTAVRDQAVHFHQVDKQSGSRIRYEKVAEKTGKQVSNDDLELGYEIGQGQLVVVDPDELAELRPRTTRTIEITDFVDLSEVDPAFYNRTYWLAPDGEAAVRAYRLLVTAMDDRAKVGVGMVVMRNKQYLAAIRPRQHALAMSTMHFANEILDASSVDSIPTGGGASPAKELKLAIQLIDSLAGPWRPESYEDTYTKDVQALIKAHEKGKDIVTEEAPAARTNITDLTEALRASVEAARRARGKNVGKAVEAAADELLAAGDEEGGTGASRSRSSSNGKSNAGPAKRTTKASRATKRVTKTSTAPARKAAKSA